MTTWNIKTNEAFQKEWKEFKDDHSTEGYDLKYVFEIYLPFWQCKQNVIVEKDLALDRFSKILLEFISYYKKSSRSNICQFLGIEEDNFCTKQLNFLENNNLIRDVGSDSYEITHEGIEFLNNRKKPRTMETEEFDYMAKEKYYFLENDMTNDFFDPLKPIDKQLSSTKKADFSGYKILQTHQEKKQDWIYIKHNNNPTYRIIKEKRTDFSEFYNAMNPSKNFYDFADNAFESHKRSICFLGFWYVNREKSDDRKIDIRQFKKSVNEFKNYELERELSKTVTEYVLKNDVHVGNENEENKVEVKAQKEELPKEEQKDVVQKLSGLAKEIAIKGLNILGKTYHYGSITLPKENNNNINDKFIKAATQSKTDSEGYILMNEFAKTLKDLGIEWNKNSGFKKFLENYNDIIEFKPNTNHGAPAIRIKPKAPKKDVFSEQKIKEADKIYIDTCSLMEKPIEKFFENINPILKEYNKKIIVLYNVELELKKIAKSGKYEPEKQKKAEIALEVLNPYANEIDISIEENDNKKTADQVFEIIFARHRNEYKILLITEDFNLSNEILNRNKDKAVRGKKCEVCRINDNGYLREFIIP